MDIPNNTELYEVTPGTSVRGEHPIDTVTRLVHSNLQTLNVTLLDTSEAPAGDISSEVAAMRDDNYVIVGNSNFNDPQWAGIEVGRRVLIFLTPRLCRCRWGYYEAL